MATPTQLDATQADVDRTKRAFVGFLNSALGIDQNYTGEDGTAYSPVNQYMVANPDGTYSLVGKPLSNTQIPAAAAGMSPLLLLGIGLAVYLLLNK